MTPLMPVTPITIISSQWTVGAIYIAALSLAGILIRQVTPWRKQANDAAAELRAALSARVDKLEAMLERQQRVAERKDARHDAEKSLANHQLQNITACFDAMLMMLKLSPDRAPEIVAEIEALRGRQMQAEAEEKAIIRAALLAGVDQAEAELADEEA